VDGICSLNSGTQWGGVVARFSLTEARHKWLTKAYYMDTLYASSMIPLTLPISLVWLTTFLRLQTLKVRIQGASSQRALCPLLSEAIVPTGINSVPQDGNWEPACCNWVLNRFVLLGMATMERQMEVCLMIWMLGCKSPCCHYSPQER
jgi:hypothetical protein